MLQTMARPLNKVETTRVTFSPSAEVVAYLDELARLGIHGKTRADVVNTMVVREVERLIKEGFLQLPKGGQR